MKTSLLGAPGFVGTALLPEAPTRGHHVAALVRNPHEAPALPQPGVPVRQVDSDDKTASKRRQTLAVRAIACCLGLGLLLTTACSKDKDSAPAATKETLRQNAISFYQALYSPAQAPADTYVAAAYTEHQVGTGFSLAGLKAYAATRGAAGSAPRPLRILRTLVQDNLVGLHVEEPITADSSVARMVLLRFNDNGQITDHWEVVQGQPRRRANSHTMFDGAAVNYQSSSGVKGRDAAIAIDQYIFNRYDTLAIRQNWTPTYVQHNPLDRDGIKGLIELVLFLKNTGATTVLTGYQRLAEGDFVMTLSHAQTTPAVPGFADIIFFDLFRLDDAGRHAEHWDALQELNGADKSKVF